MSKKSTASAAQEPETMTVAQEDVSQLREAADLGALEAMAHAGRDQIEQEEEELLQQGQKVRRLITTKDFLGGRGQEWIIRTVAPHPKGYRHMLGTLGGVIYQTKRGTVDWQGKKLESVWLQGFFEATVAETGEVIQAPNCILPLALGEMIESAFMAGATQAGLNVDIGLEATGRSIPYEWVILSYTSGRAQKALGKAREGQQGRLAAMKAGTSHQIEHKPS